MTFSLSTLCKFSSSCLRISGLGVPGDGPLPDIKCLQSSAEDIRRGLSCTGRTLLFTSSIGSHISPLTFGAVSSLSLFWGLNSGCPACVKCLFFTYRAVLLALQLTPSQFLWSYWSSASAPNMDPVQSVLFSTLGPCSPVSVLASHQPIYLAQRGTLALLWTVRNLGRCGFFWVWFLSEGAVDSPVCSFWVY